jgi:putative DNA-invertase from lambdoid prophage Rac
LQISLQIQGASRSRGELNQPRLALGHAPRACHRSTAQAQAEATKASQRAGIEHAKGREDSPYLGRKPAFTRAQFAAVRDMLGKGTTSIAQIAKVTGVKRPTVYRLKADPAAAEAALATWGM